MANANTDHPKARMIGFIDLLGSKDSSKISEDHFHNAIEQFLRILMKNQFIIGDDGAEFKYLSDSAFFELCVNHESFMFLQKSRKDLFDEKIYFKCAITLGNLFSNEIDEDFIRNMIRKDIADSKMIEQAIERAKKSFRGFFLSGAAVTAFVQHEEFKGIGFTISDSVKSICPELFVKSIFFIDDKMTRHRNYFDLTFNNDYELGTNAPSDLIEGQELRGIDSSGVDDADVVEHGWEYIRQFLRSLEIASLKRKSFVKYYLPTLISMARSIPLKDVEIVDRKLINTPSIYQKLVVENHLNKIRPKIPGINRVLLCMLDHCITQLISEKRTTMKKMEAFDSSSKVKLEEAIHKIDELIDFIFLQFGSIPNLRSSVESIHTDFLSTQTREEFLERIVSK